MPYQEIYILQGKVDPAEQEQTELRILVDQKDIKYPTMDPGVFRLEETRLAQTLTPLLLNAIRKADIYDWNRGHISRRNGRLHFHAHRKTPLPAITNIWHPLQIDYLDLKVKTELKDYVCEVRCPQFQSPVIAKFASVLWMVKRLETETSIYQWLQDEDIGPKFLGHVSENGRVIGFVVEQITGFHHAGMEDLALCQAAVKKLHGMGILHGDLNRHNMLVHNGRVILIDFECAKRCGDEGLLDEEFRSLPERLEDESGRGMPVPYVVDEEDS